MDKTPRVPKVLFKFIVKQINTFLSSKVFKKRVKEFLFGVIDDVVTLVYDDSKKQHEKGRTL